ncbi:MAG: oligopeptide/dipeptide ABC transporter ATP-binding protein [Dongiaceae bacterium]
MVELADAETLYRAPRPPLHPGAALGGAQPDPARRQARIVLAGDMPNPEEPPPGCPFHPRCPQAEAACRSGRRPAARARRRAPGGVSPRLTGASTAALSGGAKRGLSSAPRPDRTGPAERCRAIPTCAFWPDRPARRSPFSSRPGSAPA